MSADDREHSICRHCGGEIIRTCEPVNLPLNRAEGFCLGWKHAEYMESHPVISHYCGGRSIGPPAEPVAEVVAGER